MPTHEEEIQNRLADAMSGLRMGSPELYTAIRNTLDTAFEDGLLAIPPEWETPFKVECMLRPEIHGIDTTFSFNAKDLLSPLAVEILYSMEPGYDCYLPEGAPRVVLDELVDGGYVTAELNPYMGGRVAHMLTGKGVALWGKGNA